MAGYPDLREAITAGGGGASPLVQKIISPMLVEYVRKFAPTRIAFPRQTWATDTYFWNQRVSLPQAQFTTEAPPLTGTGSVAATVSTYVQKSFPVKHLQAQGDVSLFAQKVARVNGSLLDLEIEGAVSSMGWLEENCNLYGNAAATANTLRPQYDGLRTQIGPSNKIDAQSFPGSTGLLTFPMLDALMDTIRTPYAANLQGQGFFYVMSPRMQSRLVELTQPTTRVGLERAQLQPMTDGGIEGAPITVDTADPGVEVYSYRGIPLVVTSFLTSPGQMGAVSLTQSAGTTPFTGTSVRYYQMTAITIYGETSASAEVSITISTTGNSVGFTWATPSIVDPISGNALPVLSYAIWEGATTGTETLLAVIPAYDQNDNPVTAFTDLGVASTSASVFFQGGANGDGATYPNQYLSGNIGGRGEEQIYLVCRDPNLVVVPVVNEISPTLLALINVRTRQFAVTADQTMAMRAPLWAASLQRVRWA